MTLLSSETQLAQQSVQHFAQFLEEKRIKVDSWLDHYLPAAHQPPARLHEAMRYALFPGGKRLRPALVLAANEVFQANEVFARPAACAVELIHSYSLVHDDLPCMDDDDLRRGKPSCHIAFGEATAVLAGDGLLTLAFSLLSEIGDAKLSRGAVQILSKASGSLGMVGGQQEDLDHSGHQPSLEEVQAIHRLKTGCLIEASFRLGAWLGGVEEGGQMDQVGSYGRDVGLAFQIVDDILDETGDAATLGKTPGKDMREKRMTYTACMGVEAAKKEAQRLAERARETCRGFSSKKNSCLWDLTYFVVERLS